MEKKPLVSVFVGTYNQEQYIAQTLESFLMQQCDFDFEIVIGEDGSKDKTLEICQNYVEKYPDKIKLLDRVKNQGLTENFFEGLTHCEGKYIATCGGDDYWTDPLKLQKQVNILEGNPDIVITYHDSIMVDESETLISDTEAGYINRRDFTGEDLQRGVFISARTICFRNVIDFSKINYKKVINEDAFLFALLGEYGTGKYCHEIESAVYRILKKGVWSSRNELLRLKASMITYKCLIKHYKKNGKFELADFYKHKYYTWNSRTLFLAVENKQTKEVFRAYFISLLNRNSNFDKINLINLHKTLFKYLLSF